MSSAEKRLLCAALALVLCVSALALPSGAAVSSAEQVVRVGMYYKFSSVDTRWFSAYDHSDSGFELGYSDGTNFHRLTSTSLKDLVLLPEVNAELDTSSETKKCVSGSGNIGSYSVIVGSYTSWQSAVNAASGFGNGFVAVTESGFEARFGAYSTLASAQNAAGGKAVSSPKNGAITVVNADSAAIVLMYERASNPFALKSSGDGTVKLPMINRSGNVYRFSYPGYFEYGIDGSKLTMINCVPLETYTRCVMANEIGSGFTVETRKAFSVLARTVPLSHKHSSCGFDVCSSSCCQAYYGTYRMSEENNAIVDSTRGQIVTYEGSPIAVLYHGSNGGKSCSSVAAWGGTEVPYLTSVTLDTLEGVDEDKWELVFDKSEFFDYLRSRSAFSSLSDDEISMQILDTDPYGSDYITVLSVSDGSGNTVSVETSEKIRQALGFSSANFSIGYTADIDVLTSDGEETRSVAGVMTADGYVAFDSFGDDYTTTAGEKVSPSSVVIDGAGSGHGVGFSASGSETLSLTGYSYEYILEFFFNGTKLTKLYD